MKIFFSESTNSFYPAEFKKDYDKAGSWPQDAQEVEYSIFEEYGLNTPPAGKVRAHENGNFLWKDYIPSPEIMLLTEEVWLKTELLRVQEELEKVQDSDPKAVGTVSEWRSYRKALRVWPESEDYPDSTKRPQSPDNK